MQTFGKVVYEGYCNQVEHETHGNSTQWDCLPTLEKTFWECAAQSLLHFLDDQSKTHPAAFVERATA